MSDFGRMPPIFRHSGLRAAAFLIGCVMLVPSVLGHCKCRPAEKDETTRQGANQLVVEVPKETYRKLEGRVDMYDERPIENALVEVFDNPEYLLDENPLKGTPTQKRLAGRRTSSDGKFCFRDLPSGRYELRSSLDSGWNITHVYIVLDRKTGRREKIRVGMSIGT
jgi:hypothetical protein